MNEPDHIYRLALSILSETDELSLSFVGNPDAWPEVLASADLLAEAATKLQLAASAAYALQSRGVKAA